MQNICSVRPANHPANPLNQSFKSTYSLLFYSIVLSVYTIIEGFLKLVILIAQSLCKNHFDVNYFRGGVYKFSEENSRLGG